jgi:hypothetical protein
MEEYHTLLDGAVGTAPPSTVDIDGIVRAGRRGTRLRGAAVLGGTAVAVAGMLAGTVVLAGAGGSGDRSGGVPVGAPPAAVTSPATVTAPTGAPALTVVGPCHTETPGGGVRLPPVGGSGDQVVLLRLAAALQAATTTVSGTASAPIPFHYGGRGDGYHAEGVVRIGVRNAYLEVAVGPHQPTICSGALDRGGVLVCTTRRGQGGERIVSWTDTGGIDPADRTRNVVVIQKLDGTDVRLYASSLPISADGRLGELLSISQLTGIGLDPRMSILP